MSGIPTINLSEERQKELYKQLMNPKPQIPCNPEPSGSVSSLDGLEGILGDDKFGELFGITRCSSNIFYSTFGRTNSKLLTRDQIAQILLKNGLVVDIERGLKAIDNIIGNNGVGQFSLFVDRRKGIKYQLRLRAYD